MNKKYAIFKLNGDIPVQVDTLFYFDSEREAEEYMINHYDFESGHFVVMPIFYRKY